MFYSNNSQFINKRNFRINHNSIQKCRPGAKPKTLLKIFVFIFMKFAIKGSRKKIFQSDIVI